MARARRVGRESVGLDAAAQRMLAVIRPLCAAGPVTLDQAVIAIQRAGLAYTAAETALALQATPGYIRMAHRCGGMWQLIDGPVPAGGVLDALGWAVTRGAQLTVADLAQVSGCDAVVWLRHLQATGRWQADPHSCRDRTGAATMPVDPGWWGQPDVQTANQVLCWCVDTDTMFPVKAAMAVADQTGMQAAMRRVWDSGGWHAAEALLTHQRVDRVVWDAWWSSGADRASLSDVHTAHLMGMGWKRGIWATGMVRPDAVIRCIDGLVAASDSRSADQLAEPWKSMRLEMLKQITLA